ncbi:GNAT family acetyltransferase [Afipia sp. Root123D2]|uniref:GNAT family N-acetyltransferase n=1 Tax=Afipia sp. Root123D2 TaxID=1736436 RepID=UPI0006FDC802|nr:GNAT family N-acetyltransferase [Afipia sp. Root123D2]KQW21138.1 GNAT family acetyltransferase [Afipia sp. Root123D2]
MALREATRADVRRIVEMLDDDEIAKGRENLSDMTPYEVAFDAIAADANNTLYVWEEGGKVVGCLQLTFLPGLSYKGAWTAQVEGVRVDRALRGSGIGATMMEAVAAIAKARGCKALQLKTDKRRVHAHRFYERLGFAKSHEGMKLGL